LQIAVFPLKAKAWERMRKPRHDRYAAFENMGAFMACSPQADMGLAPGGKMRQEIYDDPHSITDWETSRSGRCFLHIANSLVWRSITGDDPPTVPPTAEEYTRAGLPWFDWYSDLPAMEGGEALKKLRGVNELGKQKGDAPLPENTAVHPTNVIGLGKPSKKGEVREGAF
jgi:hypothetical protein